MRMISLLVIGLALGAIAACRSEEEKKAGVSTKAVEGRDKNATKETARVTSKDGTQIAFDRTGKGPALILVSGALAHREALRGSPLVAKLSEHFSVYTYD